MNQNTQPPQAILNVCTACGHFIEYWGFKAIHGRIWAYLALHKEPLSQSEMAQILGVSRSQINRSIAELCEYGLVRQITSHHHAPYEAVLDVWPIISKVLKQREWVLIEQARIALEEAYLWLQSSDPQIHRYSLTQLQHLLTMTEWAQSGLNLLIASRSSNANERLTSFLGTALHLGQRVKDLIKS